MPAPKRTRCAVLVPAPPVWVTVLCLAATVVHTTARSDDTIVNSIGTPLPPRFGLVSDTLEWSTRFPTGGQLDVAVSVVLLPLTVSAATATYCAQVNADGHSAARVTLQSTTRTPPPVRVLRLGGETPATAGVEWSLDGLLRIECDAAAGSDDPPPRPVESHAPVLTTTADGKSADSLPLPLHLIAGVVTACPPPQDWCTSQLPPRARDAWLLDRAWRAAGQNGTFAAAVATTLAAANATAAIVAVLPRRYPLSRGAAANVTLGAPAAAALVASGRCTLALVPPRDQGWHPPGYLHFAPASTAIATAGVLPLATTQCAAQPGEWQCCVPSTAALLTAVTAATDDGSVASMPGCTPPAPLMALADGEDGAPPLCGCMAPTTAVATGSAALLPPSLVLAGQQRHTPRGATDTVRRLHAAVAAPRHGAPAGAWLARILDAALPVAPAPAPPPAPAWLEVERRDALLTDASAAAAGGAKAAARRTDSGARLRAAPPPPAAAAPVAATRPNAEMGTGPVSRQYVLPAGVPPAGADGRGSGAGTGRAGGSGGASGGAAGSSPGASGSSAGAGGGTIVGNAAGGAGPANGGSAQSGAASSAGGATSDPRTAALKPVRGMPPLPGRGVSAGAAAAVAALPGGPGAAAAAGKSTDLASGHPPAVPMPTFPDPLAFLQSILDMIMAILRSIINSILKPLLDPIIAVIQMVCGDALVAPLLGGMPSPVTAIMDAVKEAALAAATQAMEMAMAAATQAAERAQANALAQMNAYSAKLQSEVASQLAAAQGMATAAVADVQGKAMAAAGDLQGKAMAAAGDLQGKALAAAADVQGKAMAAAADVQGKAMAAAAGAAATVASAVDKAAVAAASAVGQAAAAAASAVDKAAVTAASAVDKAASAAASVADQAAATAGTAVSAAGKASTTAAGTSTANTADTAAIAQEAAAPAESTPPDASPDAVIATDSAGAAAATAAAPQSSSPITGQPPTTIVDPAAAGAAAARTALGDAVGSLLNPAILPPPGSAALTGTSPRADVVEALTLAMARGDAPLPPAAAAAAHQPAGAPPPSERLAAAYEDALRRLARRRAAAAGPRADVQLGPQLSTGMPAAAAAATAGAETAAAAAGATPSGWSQWKAGVPAALLEVSDRQPGAQARPAGALSASDTSGKNVGKSGAGGIASAVADKVIRDLCETMGDSVAKAFVPAMTVTGADALAAAVTRNMSGWLAPHLAAALRPALSRQLTDGIRAALVPRLAAAVTRDVTTAVVAESQLLPTTARAITSGTVAALSHTLHADATALYTAYYCAAHGAYCAAANATAASAAARAYQAQYYAAYYGTHYATAAATRLAAENAARVAAATTPAVRQRPWPAQRHP